MPAVAPLDARSALLGAPLRGVELVALDTETNGRPGDDCELTEVGAVLVGGGELHDRFESLVACRTPLSRGVQRLTGISQAMVDAAPPAEGTLVDLAAMLDGRVLVAHSASFDVRVLRQAFAREQLTWPDPPVLCTVALARRLAPLARRRGLRPLAEALGIEVEVSHRALADAETCARVLCALYGRLCAQASTVADAIELCRSRRPRRSRAARTDGNASMRGARRRAPDCSALPDTPGVYIFRNAAGQALYVGKSVSLRRRARAHFAPSSPDTDWVTQVEVVDHVETPSELGALLCERRLIGELRPPGNVRDKHRRDDGWVWLRCRFDIAFPILEVAAAPAAGRSINIGPLRGRHAAIELMEQLNSLFGLRRCGRALPRRDWPSAYGQMGRCLSPCLRDLDPNLYRARLDAALGLFGEGDGGRAVLEHVETEMRRAAAEQRYERAAWLRRRRRRLGELLDELGGVLAAAHSAPRLVLAAAPDRRRFDAVWLAGGRVAGHAELAAAAPAEDLAHRTVGALRAIGDVRGPLVLTADQAAEARLVATWTAANEPAVLPLRPVPADADVIAFGAAHGLAA